MGDHVHVLISISPKYSVSQVAGYLKGKHEMQIQVLDEIPYEIFKDMETDEIASMVRDKICSHVKEHLI